MLTTGKSGQEVLCSYLHYFCNFYANFKLHIQNPELQRKGNDK